MNIFKNDSEGFTSRSGLYCVWVPLRDDGRAPLVSIWIDSSMTAFELQAQQDAIALPGANEAVMADDSDDPKRCIADAVRAIEVGF